jgi:crotonobetainyl-CoA:carnitine CoA-transferase CaiB-like acyl-CoA transferase
MRSSAPAWDTALRAGKDSLQLDLKRDPAPVLELAREGDVVLESFRPGVASRLGIGPEHAPERTVYCSITGFGLGGRHEGAEPMIERGRSLTGGCRGGPRAGWARLTGMPFRADS